MNYMKDYKMLNISLEEDNKCFSGKFSFGKESHLENKDHYISFIKSNSFWKSKLKKMLYKRKNFHLVLRLTKLKNLLICTWISITMINKTLPSRTSLTFVVKRHWKLLNNKNYQAELWILDALLEELLLS